MPELSTSGFRQLQFSQLHRRSDLDIGDDAVQLGIGIAAGSVTQQPRQTLQSLSRHAARASPQTQLLQFIKNIGGSQHGLAPPLRCIGHFLEGQQGRGIETGLVGLHHFGLHFGQ